MPYISPEHLEREHLRCKEHCLRLFHTTRKMGGKDFSQTYSDKLEEEMNELYDNFVHHNESKNIFAAARTPAVLFAVMVLCYFVAGLFGIIGLESFANIVNLGMTVALLLLITWAYVRYSGEYREVGAHIDKVADFIWDVVSTSVCFSSSCPPCLELNHTDIITIVYTCTFLSSCKCLHGLDYNCWSVVLF